LPLDPRRIAGIRQRPANLGTNLLIRPRQQLLLQPPGFALADDRTVGWWRDDLIIHDPYLLKWDPRNEVNCQPPHPQPNIRRQTLAGAISAE
jgi:hypothetical protein